MLVTDISRQARLPLTVNNNDTEASYDRIVLWIASLTLQRIDISKNTVFLMIKPQQTATHDINTVFGISIETYSPTTPLN